MRHRIAILGSVVVLAAFLLSGCAAPEPPQPQDVTEEIQVINGEFMAAVSAKDAEALAALYTQDGKILPPNNEVVSGRTALEGFGQALTEMVAEAKLTTEEAEGFGDTAWEVGRYTMLDSAGNAIDEGKYIVIWKRTDDGWRLHRDIWNSSRPMPTD